MSQHGHASGASTGGCPVDHSKFTRDGAPPNPMLQPAAPAQPASLGCDSSALSASPLPPMTGTCPVDHSQFRSSSAASSSVSPQSIVGDHFPDSTRSPTQLLPLSTAPVASRIPKGGLSPDGSALPADATWIFPSPQRFYNAMAKKGWDPKERDMSWVVGIHNRVNEKTWEAVAEYEGLHKGQCETPKLVRFRGRPADLSPKARIMSWFGYVAPFDRHDWVVDRCGREVRYIIDFYNGSPSATAGSMGMDLPGMPPAIHLDVRPALDSPGAAWDRIRMQWRQWTGASSK